MSHYRRTTALVGLVTWASLLNSASADPVTLSKQLRDGEPAQQMTAAEFAALRDPLFLLVLKDHADLIRLSQIEDRLQPDPKKRQVFVVHENIIDPRPSQSRRSVLTFEGSSPDGTVLGTNVMLSVFFDSDQFPDAPDAIE